MRNARLDEAQAGIKIARRNINNLKYADDTTLMAESEELKSLLMKVKEESEKLALNSTFRKRRLWHPVPSLHGKQMGKQWKQWQALFWWGSKITADGDWRHEIKRCLFLGRKAMTNLDSVLKKQRHYFANKSLSSQSYCFSSSHVWMWELGVWRKLSAKELMLFSCDVGEDSWECLGLQGDPTSPS